MKSPCRSPPSSLRMATYPSRATDIRVMITKITDQMPSPDEVERVKKYLEARGWPISDQFPLPGGR